MAKSSKKSKETEALTDQTPAAQTPEMQPGNGTAKAKKEPVTKSTAKKAASTKATAKRRSITPRKSTTPRKPRAIKPANSSPAEVSVSDDDVRMRAYFLSERRQQQGLPGDSAHDWLEARRQLQEEAIQRG